MSAAALRAGLFNPQSFLTAVMQTTARRNDWPLDKTVARMHARRLPLQSCSDVCGDSAAEAEAGRTCRS